MDELLGRIDALTSPVCAWCQNTLADSPSEHWCGEACQRAWTKHHQDVVWLVADEPPELLPEQAAAVRQMALRVRAEHERRMAAVGSAAQAMARNLSDGLAQLGRALSAASASYLASAGADAQAATEPGRSEVMARALELRRHPNTGPPVPPLIDGRHRRRPRHSPAPWADRPKSPGCP